MTIYDSHDTPVYQRASNHPIPGCCGISPPTPGNCNVCLDLNVTIICSNDTEPVEVEDSEGKGLPIVATSPVSCMYDMKLIATHWNTVTGVIRRSCWCCFNFSSLGVQHHTQGHYGLFLSGGMYLTQALNVNSTHELHNFQQSQIIFFLLPWPMCFHFTAIILILSAALLIYSQVSVTQCGHWSHNRL